jgi:hypothetical protein
MVPGGWQNREGDGHQNGKGNAWAANAAGEELSLASRTKASLSKPRNSANLLQRCMAWHVHLGCDPLLAVFPCQGIADLCGPGNLRVNVTT